MRIIWTPETQQDRADVWDYIAATIHALRPGWMSFSAMRASLTEHPKMGRPGKISGTRELIPHENYRLMYEVGNETVWILALVHIARQWPPMRD